MNRRVSDFILTLCVAIALGYCLLLSACGAAKGAVEAALAPAPSGSALLPAAVLVSAPAEAGGASASEGSAIVPVSAVDPQWGARSAPVTIVEFSDFQCPFCSRVNATLKRIQDVYRDQVRLVFKHNPLPFHDRARPAAEAAATVFGLAGSRAFWSFQELAFENQQGLSDENFAIWAERAGVDRAKFREAYAAKTFAEKVDADLELSKKVGATGTPAFRINGVTVSGAQPFDKFQEVIEGQLAEARKLRAAGTPAVDIYAALTNRNQREEKVAAPQPAREEDDESVWKVRVLSDDPRRGPKDAPVTIIVFSDYQCPFCKQVEQTLKSLTDQYGDQVRLVWKDNPLPFHERARPAAEFARFVFSKKGDQGFWAAHDALFESSPQLGEEELEIIAAKLGINWAAAKAASAQQRFRNRLDQSIELAADFQAWGTPHFFINGVRLSGAQPLEKFQELVDEQLARAKELLARGVPPAGLYAALIQDGKEPPGPETKRVPPPDATTPFRGNPRAKVVIQEWSDFQCPFCKRVQATLAELEKEYPGQIKLVYRHLPLPFHQQALLAAEAAQEAFAQKGNRGFWAFHDRLFDAQAEPDGLARASLEEMARKQGLDLARFQAALDSHQHRKKVEADAQAANDANISGTPGFVINEYFLAGAQPAVAFKKLIRKALAGGKKP